MRSTSRRPRWPSGVGGVIDQQVQAFRLLSKFLPRLNWSDAAGAIGKRISRNLRTDAVLAPHRVAAALYRGILEREPDLPGLAQKVDALRYGETLEQVIRSLIGSPEFRSRFLKSLAQPDELPDLTGAMPARYQLQEAYGRPIRVYIAESDDDINVMSSLIDRHRYYDRFGVWSPSIDLDKEIIAAIVRGLGAHSCFELGCFTGPVLSLLANAGIAVQGSEVSHLAFAFAYPNVRDAILFGDFLKLQIDQRFDVVLCMDVLEHVNPLRLDDYIRKCASLLNEHGYLYVNSPMWGEDPVFGIAEEPYLAEWTQRKDASYWRHWPCDEKGWPIHGHLVWASPGWWEEKFAAHGLVRDTVIERAIHRTLCGFFAQATGRRSLFVLRPAASPLLSPPVAAEVHAALLALPGLASGLDAQSQG